MQPPRNDNRLLVGIICGIVCGALLGGLWPAAGLAVKLLGTLFLHALKMVVVPLVITSMVVGVSRLGDVRRLGRVGGITIAYYLSTTAIAVIIGIILVNAIGPGRADSQARRLALRGGRLLPQADYSIAGRTLTVAGANLKSGYDGRYRVELLDQPGVKGVIAACDRARGLIEVRAWLTAAGKASLPRPRGKGVRIDLALADQVKGKDRRVGAVLERMLIKLIPTNLFKAMVDTDVLPLILFSLVLGAILTTIPARGRQVLEMFEGFNDAIMQLVHLIMLVSPVGIGALVAGRLAGAGGFSGFWVELVVVGGYALTVIAGLALHGLLVLPLLLRFAGGRAPLAFIRGLAPALASAFSTASSSATLPLTIDCATRRCRVSQQSAGFVLPLGATINMDGTALYEAVAAIFIAQVYGLDLGTGAMVVIFLTATLAAIGAAGIPEAGLVTMVVVLEAVGLPVEGISLILIVDWFLDRCRTTVNVWGDTVGAAVVEHFTPRFGDKPPEPA